MSRPWTWTLTESGQVHATAAEHWPPGVEISAVCGAMVATSAQVEVGRGDPCLSCLQLVGAIDWCSRRVVAR